MASNLIPRGGPLAALASAMLLMAAPAGTASALTLFSPSIAAPAPSPDVQPVWWDSWGRWHPNHRHWGWRRWGWGPPPPPPPPWGFYGDGYGYRYGQPVRHCWRGPWGAVRCRWG